MMPSMFIDSGIKQILIVYVTVQHKNIFLHQFTIKNIFLHQFTIKKYFYTNLL
jgi:hypothetical protein